MRLLKLANRMFNRLLSGSRDTKLTEGTKLLQGGEMRVGTREEDDAKPFRAFKGSNFMGSLPINDVHLLKIQDV